MVIWGVPTATWANGKRHWRNISESHRLLPRAPSYSGLIIIFTRTESISGSRGVVRQGNIAGNGRCMLCISINISWPQSGVTEQQWRRKSSGSQRSPMGTSAMLSNQTWLHSMVNWRQFQNLRKEAANLAERSGNVSRQHPIWHPKPASKPVSVIAEAYPRVRQKHLLCRAQERESILSGPCRCAAGLTRLSRWQRSGRRP